MIVRPVLLISTLVVGLAGTVQAEALELSLRPGWTGAGHGSPVVDSPGRFLGTSADVTYRDARGTPLTYGSGPSGELQVSWRFVPLLAIGLSTAFRLSSSSQSELANVSVRRWGWRLGPTLRAHLPAFGGFEPWASLGVGYAEDRQVIQSNAPVRSESATYGIKIAHRGVVIPIGVGIDYRLSRLFSVGPSFEIARTFALSGCFENVSLASTAKACSTDDDPTVSAKGYTTWTFAIGARMSL